MNVWILSATGTYLPAIERVVAAMPIAGLIGLAPGSPDDVVSGYFDYSDWCRERAIRHETVEKYALPPESNHARFAALDIDVLLVLGWQRLVPNWLIELCHGKVIGVHGSSAGITAGRGRSPLNWALMLRQSRFFVSLFFISPGIDDGPVIATRDFPLTLDDDIETAYWKMSITVGDLLATEQTWAALEPASAQSQGGSASYLPQRQPDDGMIDWNRDMEDIIAFVRALTRPYPGAFSMPDGGDKIRIWRARPFKLANVGTDLACGEVAERFADGRFLVRCANGFVLIDDHEAPAAMTAGTRLASANWVDQIAAIIDRHRSRYPSLPVTPELLAIAAPH
ncbi:conserved hypothetical protein [Magnetospirillum sp. LM-5]|uniref:methionyl-tRNA formyltransferase n=1 Tax=Magnetospirillum sp. LM-5 TaxID=2681466 RepID=UPI00137FF15B|nr:formyltransferase family protein [Magnetospirillum sp. LM-5]CAA7619082.1 conserved hypothetical protein [Magnetospirillum sp. LM-5]